MHKHSIKTARPVRLSLLALALTLSCTSSRAQEPGFYLGAGLGQAQADIDTNAVLSRLKSTGATSATFSTSDDDQMTKVFGGYRFNRHFALETSFSDLGEYSFAASAVPAAMQQGNATIRGLSLDAIGSLPLRDNLAAFIRLGINNLGIRQHFSNAAMGAGFANGNDRGTHANYGVGLEYAINSAFSLRAEVEQFQIASNRVTNNNVNVIALSALYKFGKETPPAPPVAKPAPAPAPAAPAPTPPPFMKVTLAASALFDFDRSELKPAGKQELDKLVQDLKSVRYDLIIVTGHTDRIGTHVYNLALSERRATAVKNYLVTAGIASGNITAKGVNSDQPVTKNEQCRGTGSAAAQKACLQPDRRVEIEVNGTRSP